MSKLDIVFDYITPETYDLISYFDCGHEGINNFLYEKAKEFDDNRLGLTHLVIDLSKNRIMGYYTLKNSSLLYTVNNGKSFRGIPCTEIYMFAIDKNYQGVKFNEDVNISDMILSDAITKIAINSNEFSASRFIILNSLDKSINFYKKNFFINFNDFMTYLDDDKAMNVRIKHPMYMAIE